MELKQFITETLKGILAGVTEAQNSLGLPQDSRLANLRSAINPAKMQGSNLINEGLRDVDFDIAVTVNETMGSAASGKAGINVVGLSGDLHQETSHSKVSRIRFQVPVRFQGFNL